MCGCRELMRSRGSGDDGNGGVGHSSSNTFVWYDGNPGDILVDVHHGLTMSTLKTVKVRNFMIEGFENGYYLFICCREQLEVANLPHIRSFSLLWLFIC